MQKPVELHEAVLLFLSSLLTSTSTPPASSRYFQRTSYPLSKHSSSTCTSTVASNNTVPCAVHKFFVSWLPSRRCCENCLLVHLAHHHSHHQPFYFILQASVTVRCGTLICNRSPTSQPISPRAHEPPSPHTRQPDHQARPRTSAAISPAERTSCRHSLGTHHRAALKPRPDSSWWKRWSS